jgi:hypothetical protein
MNKSHLIWALGIALAVLLICAIAAASFFMFFFAATQQIDDSESNTSSSSAQTSTPPIVDGYLEYRGAKIKLSFLDNSYAFNTSRIAQFIQHENNIYGTVFQQDSVGAFMFSADLQTKNVRWYNKLMIEHDVPRSLTIDASGKELIVNFSTPAYKSFTNTYALSDGKLVKEKTQPTVSYFLYNGEVGDRVRTAGQGQQCASTQPAADEWCFVKVISKTVQPRQDLSGEQALKLALEGLFNHAQNQRDFPGYNSFLLDRDVRVEVTHEYLPISINLVTDDIETRHGGVDLSSHLMKTQIEFTVQQYFWAYDITLNGSKESYSLWNTWGGG